MKIQNRITIHNSLLIAVAIFSLLLFGQKLYQYIHLGEKSMESVLKTTEEALNRELNALEAKLSLGFGQAESIAQEMAQSLNKSPVALKKIIPNIATKVHQYNFSALGIHFSEAYSKKLMKDGPKDYLSKNKNGKQLYSPFFKNGMNTVIPFPYDYTDVDSNGRYWYSEKIVQGSWTKPYFGPANRNFVLSYRAPLHANLKKESNQGIICVDYSLNSIGKTVGELNLLKSGYGIVINQDSVIISHPVEEVLGKRISNSGLDSLSIFKLLDTIQEKQFLDLSQDKSMMLNGKLVYKRTIDVAPPNYKKDDHAFQYQVLIILNKREALTAFGQGGQQSFYSSENSLRILLIVIGVICLLALIHLVYQLLKKKNIWMLVAMYAIVCASGICFIWFCHLEFSIKSSFREETVANNETDLAAIVNYFNNEQKKELDSLYRPPIKVKTGFFIQSVKFSSATDILMTGYVWLKKSGLNKEVRAGLKDLDFIFPEAQDFNAELVFSNEEFSRWYFTATLRQSFDYSQYPFDDEEIWLRIQPSNFDQNKVLLVPDFESYPSFIHESSRKVVKEGNITEQGIYGLENDIFIEGWDIRGTYFSFRKNAYSSNFGTQKIVQLPVQPELYFNISIRRNFTGVFVAYMIPILVTAFLLFTVVMINTKDRDKNELLGFNSATVLSFCASLFFVLTVSHMSLRETLATKGVIYLEYFFFCLYIALAIISVYSIIFAQSNSSSRAHSNDGRLIKLCFWPVLLICLLLVTAICFNY